MATDEVKYKITADSSKYERASARVTSATQRMANAVTKNVGLMAAAFGATLVYGMKKAVDAAIEQEAVERRLAAVVRATGGAAGFTAQEMFDMAGAMQRVTTVGDETIIKGQAVLATFKQIRGEGFERATMAALDMSEVMQSDLNSSIVMIGKALNDPIANLSAMSRAGVQFTEDQKSMVKELWEGGDAAGAQSIILRELESQFGGAAVAAKDQFGGALKSLNNTFGDLLEAVGFSITKNKEFIGIIKDLESSFGNLIKVFEGSKSFWEFFLGESKLEEGKRLAREQGLAIAKEAAASYQNEFSGVGSGGAPETKGGVSEATRQTMEDEHAFYLNHFSRIDEASLASIEKRQIYEQTARDQRIEAILNENMAVLTAKQQLDQQLHDMNAISAADEIAIAQMVADQKRQIDQQKMQSVQFTTNNMIKTGKMLLQSVAKDNRALFEATKALSIGQVVMSTAAGAANAMRDVPYPFNFLAAASVIAFGAAQIAQISSQNMGGGGAPSSTGGAVGVPMVSSTTSPIVDVLPGSDSRGATTTIIIEGDIFGDEATIDMLVDKINVAGDDRDVIIKHARTAVTADTLSA